VTLEVDTHGDPVNGAAAHGNFDPSLLQLISITPGVTLPTIVRSSFDNHAGQADYVSRLPAGPASGRFVLAVLTFQAVAVSPGASFSFSTAEPRKTDITYYDQSVLQSLNPDVRVIIAATRDQYDYVYLPLVGR